MRLYAARDLSGVLSLFQNKPIYDEGSFYPDDGDCWVIGGLDGDSGPEQFAHVAPGECVECCVVVGDKVDFALDPAAVAV